MQNGELPTGPNDGGSGRTWSARQGILPLMLVVVMLIGPVLEDERRVATIEGFAWKLDGDALDRATVLMQDLVRDRRSCASTTVVETASSVIVVPLRHGEARLAQALGGQITLQSEVGSGSTFTLWLPLDKAEESAAATPATVVRKVQRNHPPTCQVDVPRTRTSLPSGVRAPADFRLAGSGSVAPPHTLQAAGLWKHS